MSFKTNIEEKTLNNSFYRKVIYTTPDLQLVLMSLLPHQEIGMEKHDGTQFIRIEDGSGIAIINGKRQTLTDGSAIIIRKNTCHNIISGSHGMKIYTIYSPPQHPKNAKEKYKK
jgi:quercetin dioxygenase-like cupin family protein